MSQVRTRENTFKVDLSNFPKRPSIEELQKFVLVNLGLASGQIKRFQVNHAQNCAHVKCIDLKTAQDTVAKHDGKHEIEVSKTKVKVRLVMEDGGVEVKVHDLSENVSNEEIVAFLRNYGDVLNIREVSWGESFPLSGMSSGIRVAKMVLRRHIKSFVTIQSEQTLISYRGQPQTCKHCTLTQHVGISCVENKKLLNQKADLNARLDNARRQQEPKSYAGVASSLDANTSVTNTLMPEFSGTRLGPLPPRRQIPSGAQVQPGPEPISSGNEASSLNRVEKPMDVVELSASAQGSGGDTSSSDQTIPASVTEVSVGLAAAASGGGAMNVCPNEVTSLDSERSVELTEVTSGGGMMPDPLLSAAHTAGDHEKMESENQSAANVNAVDLNTHLQQENQLMVIDGDTEMPLSQDTASSASVSPFKSPFPVLDPDLKHARPLSSISGSESDNGEPSDFTTVEKKRRGRPKKPKL